MARKMLIDATHAEETRVVVVNGNKVEEFEFETAARSQITGNIYLAKIARVEPSLQAAFLDYGGNRHGFLAFSEIHPDYYQIPKADREALLREEESREKAAEAEIDAEVGTEEATPEKEGNNERRGRRTQFGYRRDKAASQNGNGDAQGADEAETTAEEANEAPKPRSKSRKRRRNKTQAADVEQPATSADSEALLGDPRGDDDNDEEDDAFSHSDEQRPNRKKNKDNGNGDSDSDEAEDDIRKDQQRRRSAPPRRYKIQEVIKVRQILLVQVLKEERGNKGAALTTYLSLPGRYCVLMPNTARGGGISRKIANAADRKRLKTIASGLKIPQGAGLIIRTAGARQEAAEIERDYHFLTRQWSQIRELTMRSIAPAAIYAESGPVKRAIRDLLTRDVDEILVEGKEGYNEARSYTELLMPDRAKTVKHYEDPMPLFSRYQVESLLSSMFNPVVQLKSGGYLVFGVTEALVAVDVNSGRSTKEGSIEQTAVKTNLEAAEEVARQLKLRDLAGLIVIDFIDMDQRRNNIDVENRLKEALKKDRARIQVGRISNFGLLEMSRQRLRSGLIEVITQPCPHCQGTGVTRSDDSIALSILRSIEDEIYRNKAKELVVNLPVGVANYLFNEKRDHLQALEARSGIVIRLEARTDIMSPSFEIEKLSTPSRAPVAPDLVTADTVIELAEAVEETPEVVEPAEQKPEPKDEKPKRKRRRRGRNKKNDQQNGEAQTDTANADQDPPQHAKDAPKAEETPQAEPAKVEAADVEVKSATKPVKTDEDLLAGFTPKKRARRTKPEIEADRAAKTAEKDAKQTARNAKTAQDSHKKAEKAVERAKTDEAKAKAETDLAEAETALQQAQKAQRDADRKASELRKASDKLNAEAEAAHIEREKAKFLKDRQTKPEKADPAPAEAPAAEADVKDAQPAIEEKPVAPETPAPTETPAETEPEVEAETPAKAEEETPQKAEPVVETVADAPVEDKNVEEKKPRKKRKTGWWSA